jgi:predicted aminopeptidase
MVVVLVGVLVGLSGCASLSWYGQAASGQIDLLSKREDIVQLLADPATDPVLAKRLRLALELRAFAVAELGLPDSPSYTQYADLGRDAAVWNVVAAPRFEVQPKTWCYPLVGCLAYRGFFKRDQAVAFVEELVAEGYDAALFPVPAYSTLGWFADPVLNTMLDRGEPWLAGLIFHELTHERLFLKGDTAFSEGYAVAVERIGVERWLRSRGQVAQLEAWRTSRALQGQFTELLLAARQELSMLYGENIPEAAKTQRRLKVFEALKTEVSALDEAAGGRFSRWTSREINNAHLALVATYESSVDGFLLIFESCQRDIQCFHDRVAELSEADADTRMRLLSDTGPLATDPG